MNKNTTQDRATEVAQLKHTPGPWRAATSGPRMRGYSQPFAIASISQEGQLVAGAFGDVAGGLERAAANARLIAAAPDLLEKLKALLDLAERKLDGPAQFGQVLGARAAIARAEGTAP